MGVPRLFRYICDKYPDVILNINSGTFCRTIDNLYLDSNALIHKAAQIAFNYGQYKSSLPVCDPALPYPQKISELFQIFWRELISIVETIVPTRLLYIAVDGCAPCGKQAQQRQRRFIASKKGGESEFDSCSISPGTLFMWELHKFINYSIRKEIQGGNFRNIKVIYDPYTVPGEGEHKIISYIRKSPYKYNQSHCMWGPDGDLIMLTLTTNCDSFFWLRDDNICHYQTTLVDIGKLSKLIRREIFSINDFILMGFFVGNDFLPKIAMFDLLEQGFKTMIEQYSLLRISLTTNGAINLAEFSSFIENMASQEQELLSSQVNGISVLDKKFLNLTLLNCASNCIEESSKENGNNRPFRKILDYSRYRKAYYGDKLGIHSETEIEKLCEDYLRGIYWVFLYYTKQCPSFLWYYPHHYAPLFSDFLRFVSQHRFDFDPTQWPFSRSPIEPFQQLISILPPSSVGLLPKEYRYLMSPQKRSPLSEYYPLDFKVDYEGKHQDYEGIALLPFVDPLKVQKVYNEIKRKAKPHRRNERGYIRLFFYSFKTPNYRYKCDYGIIENCSVRNQKLR